MLETNLTINHCLEFECLKVIIWSGYCVFFKEKKKHQNLKISLPTKSTHPRTQNHWKTKSVWFCYQNLAGLEENSSNLMLSVLYVIFDFQMIVHYISLLEKELLWRIKFYLFRLKVLTIFSTLRYVQPIVKNAMRNTGQNLM